MSNRAEKKRESHKFVSTLESLGYESIGDFIEMCGGLVGILIDEESTQKETAKEMAQQFVMQTGIIIEQIGHLDKIIERNEELKKSAEKAKENKDKLERACFDKNDPNKKVLYDVNGNIL